MNSQEDSSLDERDERETFDDRDNWDFPPEQSNSKTNKLEPEQLKRPENRLKTFYKSRTVWVVVVIAVALIMLRFSIEGYASSRADGHKEKSCNALYGIGNYVREGIVWGEGIDSTTPASKIKLDYAVTEAVKAGGADHTHYGVFENAVITFAYSLQGKTLGGDIVLYSPYTVYTYTVYPICINFGYLDNQ